MTGESDQRGLEDAVRRFLARNSVFCEHCGHDLRGLPEPRCPECGEWTDLARHMGDEPPRPILLRAGNVAASDTCLVLLHGEGARRTVDYQEIVSLAMVRRRSVRHPTLMWLVGLLVAVPGAIGAIAFFTLMGWRAFTVMTILGPLGCLPLFIAGMGVWLILEGLVPRWHPWIEIHTPSRRLSIPVQKATTEEVQRLVEFVSSRAGIIRAAK